MSVKSFVTIHQMISLYKAILPFRIIIVGRLLKCLCRLEDDMNCIKRDTEAKCTSMIYIAFCYLANNVMVLLNFYPCICSAL